MKTPLERYVLDVFRDESFFQKVGGRNRFRFRLVHEYIRFRSTPARARLNAKRHFRAFLERKGIVFLPDSVLYKEVKS